LIIEFKIGATHVLNLGNYESFRVECGVTVSVSESDDLEILKNEAQVKLRELLEETYLAQYPKKLKSG